MKRDIIYLIVLILITVIGAYFIGATLKEEEYTGEFNTYVVLPGETLWSIASDICKSSDAELNIQNVIIKIKNDNGMNDCTIYAWQELKLRTDY